MFPTAHSQVYRNEAGEVLGWDTPSDRDEWYDPDDYLNHDDDTDMDEDSGSKILCDHGRDYRTAQDDGTSVCACGQRFKTDGRTPIDG